MTAATAAASGGVAERLRSVSTASDLHDLLVDLARDPDSHWRRTQVLFYLPEAFHRIAEDYFDGEQIIVPDRQAAQLEPAPVVPLADALAHIEELGKVERTAESRDAEEKADQSEPVSLSNLDAPPPRGPSDIVGHVLQAIRDEAIAVDKRSPKRYRLTKGRCTGVEGDQFIYVFDWSSEPELYAPGELRLGGRVLGARVGGQSEGKSCFELRLPEYLGAAVDTASFFIDPTFLLRTQYQQLRPFREDVEAGLTRVGDLFRKPDPVTLSAASNSESVLNAAQRRAIDVVTQAERSYVWGPPGTGKTTTLGHLIRELATAGKRVLILSPYNVAVDAAVESAFGSGGWAHGDIVRFGRVNPKIRKLGIDIESILEEYAKAHGILSVARELHASVMQELGVAGAPTPATVRGCLEDLGFQIYSRGEAGSPQAKAVNGAMAKIRAAFRAPERKIVERARVIATTVSLSMMSEAIGTGNYDYVLVDEASVMRVPDAVLVALRASGRLAFFGDPKQLPPIVVHRSPETFKWLKRNPFELAGIKDTTDATGACVLLTEQHRMAPPIRALVSSLFYDGRLEDGNAPSGGRVMLVDTSKTNARATTRWMKMSQSKENLTHRSLVGSLLAALFADKPEISVLILSPYRAQKRGYEKEAITNRFRRVDSKTVHSSQGGEADVVILDLVIAPGRGKSRFMDDRITPELRNLMNVAMSRAKRQLIVVGHVEYVAEHYPGGLVIDVIGRIQQGHSVIQVPSTMRVGELFATALD